MKKPINKLDQPELKHLFSQDSISPLVISKAGIRKNKSLKPVDQKDLATADSQKSSEGSPARARSRRSRKSVKGFESNEMGFLASQHARKRSANKANIFVRLHIILLLIGFLGTTACIWAMVYTAHSEEVAAKLGMVRVANSLENVLSVLAIPALLFNIILTAYAIQQLYVAYRRANYLDSGRRR